MIIESSDIIKNPIVSVVVITYRQEQYITQCIDAILSQKTDFPFEIIISDDCSPDKTSSICKDYQKRYHSIIRVLIQNENRGVARNFAEAINLARGKYISIVAGDDYWILNSKLQQQKDYLDSHPQCILCYTNINTCDEDGHLIETEYMNKHFRPQSFEEFLVDQSFIAPLTWMYRKELLREYSVEAAQTDESFAVALDAFAISEVHYIDVVTANYRLTTTSLTRPGDSLKFYRQWLGVFKTQCYFMNKYSHLIDSTKCFQVKTNGYFEFLPMAYEFGDDGFIEEAKSYFNFIGLNINPFLNACSVRISAEHARKSLSYRIGNTILKPFKLLIDALKRIQHLR